MTQRRNHPDAISNYFDTLLAGIGHRGSSFTDVDAMTHDGDTHRFLFQEFKQPGERMHRAQKIAMKDLCARGSEFITVWCVRRREDGLIDFCDVAVSRLDVIPVAEYQERFRLWWAGQWPPPDNGNTREPGEDDDAPELLTAAEINWGRF